MSSQHIQKNFPGVLHTPAKYEKNPPYGCEAIAKRKCGCGGVASSLHEGRLIQKFMSVKNMPNKLHLTDAKGCMFSKLCLGSI